jgi:hypothetical protein
MHLTTTKQIANFINDKKMDELSDENDISTLEKEIHFKDEIIYKDMYPLQDELSIKMGMKIIFVMNDSSIKGRRWVNGTRGKVVGKHYNNNNELEIVDISIETEEENRTHTVTKEWYDIYIPTYNEALKKIEALKIASVYQFPFIAAWAITIHRSQSLTIDSCVQLELGETVFAEGQLYVGLSRVRNMENLFLNRSITKRDILVSEETKSFDTFLKRQKRLVKNIIIEPTQFDMGFLMSDSVANNFRSYYEPEEEKNNFELIQEIFIHHKEQAKTARSLPKNIAVESTFNNKIYKTKRAPEGLDKITIILNPYYIDLENKIINLYSRNELTLHKGGPFRMISIHAEFINHKQDIHISFARAVYFLIEKGILNIDFLKNIDKDKAIYFIFKH